MNEHIKVIEINGVKLEVDLRTAKKIENYKVGDHVKVLKKGYGNDYKVYPGMIVSFDQFEKLPTVVIAYCEVEYSSAKISYAYLNSQTEGIEIAPMNTAVELPFEKSRVVDLMEREIVKKEHELDEARAKLDFFLRQFGSMFERQEGAMTQ